MTGAAQGRRHRGPGPAGADHADSQLGRVRLRPPGQAPGSSSRLSDRTMAVLSVRVGQVVVVVVVGRIRRPADAFQVERGRDQRDRRYGGERR